MPDITFYSWLIISNIWLAASYGVNDSVGKTICNIIGIAWLLIAIFGKLVS